jgi:hypothetical protein
MIKNLEKIKQKQEIALNTTVKMVLVPGKIRSPVGRDHFGRNRNILHPSV